MLLWQIVKSWCNSAYQLFIMSMMTLWWLHVAMLLIALSLPPALKSKSWKSFFAALPKVAFGVLLPIPIFGFSVFLVPDSKAACRYGWFDCFYMGKTALMPIVFWATAALYANDVLKAQRRPWIVLGIFMGAVTSSLLFLYGLMLPGISHNVSPLILVLAVPAYVAVWYSVRTIQLARSGTVRPAAYLYAQLASIPFWGAGIVWAMKVYRELPEHPPDCFVVTAACRGHEGVVGPFVVIQRGGRPRRANRQLLTFWRFEALWDERWPKSHRLFRRFYNVWGPRMARLLGNRWLADLAYFLLKPPELLARLLTARTPPSSV